MQAGVSKFTQVLKEVKVGWWRQCLNPKPQGTSAVISQVRVEPGAKRPG